MVGIKHVGDSQGIEPISKRVPVDTTQKGDPIWVAFFYGRCVQHRAFFQQLRRDRLANPETLLFFKNAAGPDGPRSEDRFFEWLDHDLKEHEGDAAVVILAEKENARKNS